MSNIPPQTPRWAFNLSAEDLKARLKEVIFFLPSFLKHPFESMKSVPSWDWPAVIMLEVVLAGGSSVLGGIVSRNFLSVIGGVIIGPVRGLAVTFILAGFFYYTCLFWLKTELEFRKLFIVAVMALIPSEILEIISPLARPVNFISLLGIVISAGLLVTGLVENFLLDKKKVFQMVGAASGFVILIWFYGIIMDITSNHIKVQDYTPASLDQIHKELEHGSQ